MRSSLALCALLLVGPVVAGQSRLLCDPTSPFFDRKWCLDPTQLDSAVTEYYQRAIRSGGPELHRALARDQAAFLAYLAAEESLSVQLKGDPAVVRQSLMRDRRFFFQKLFGEWTELDEAAARVRMRQELRDLIVAEENLFVDSVKYSTSLSQRYFQLPSGDTLLFLRLTPDGWIGRIGTVQTKTVCTIFIGKTSLAPAVKEGYPVCQ